MQNLCIAQITDIHLSHDKSPVHGIDTQSRWQEVLQLIKEDKQVNSLVITGDICHDTPSIAQYQEIKSQIEALNIHYHVLPGNHDDARMMAEVFGLNEWYNEDHLFYTEEYDFGKILFLDSSKSTLSIDQLIWIVEECNSSHYKFLLFLHHPPVYAGVPFMDINYPLLNRNEVQKVLAKANNIQGIFCGHYHVARAVRMQHHVVFLSPSNAFQIDDSTEELVIKHTPVAYRKIFWDGSNMRTHIVWGNK